jgi:hypothetical protein
MTLHSARTAHFPRASPQRCAEWQVAVQQKESLRLSDAKTASTTKGPSLFASAGIPIKRKRAPAVYGEPDL